MKPKDLFIGAWVRPKNINAPFQVFSVDSELICDKGEHSWCLDEIEPIPITPESLEKDGWRNSARNVWQKEYAEDVVFYWEEDTHWGGLDDFSHHGNKMQLRFKFEYFHELQAALRLCGIEKEIVL